MSSDAGGIIGRCLGGCVEPRKEGFELGASGASTTISPLSSGCAKRMRCACRNMRFNPCRASALFHAKSPYLSSPARGNPRWVRWTRIWCVRPVSSSASSSTDRRIRLRPRLDLAEDRSREPPVLVHPDAPLAVAGHVRGQRQFDRCATHPAICHGPAPYSACRSRRREAGRAIRSAPGAFLRSAARPTYRGPADGRAPGNAAPGRAWRIRSMTPNAMPLPPCTARPAGLSRAMRASSSYRIGGIGNAREPATETVRCGAEARIGGIRS